MLDLLLKLIDKLSDLAKRKEQLSRNLFTDFVEPAMKEFDVVHKGYVSTFVEYRSLITAAKLDELDEVKKRLIDKIAIDNLVTAGDRSRLWQLEDKASDPVIGPFITSIMRYINFNRHWRPDSPDTESVRKYGVESFGRTTQCIRTYGIGDAILFFRALSVDVEDQRSLLIDRLDSLFNNVNSFYDDVIAQHTALRKKLLTPI